MKKLSEALPPNSTLQERETGATEDVLLNQLADRVPNDLFLARIVHSEEDNEYEEEAKTQARKWNKPDGQPVAS